MISALAPPCKHPSVPHVVVANNLLSTTVGLFFVYTCTTTPRCSPHAVDRWGAADCFREGGGGVVCVQQATRELLQEKAASSVAIVLQRAGSARCCNGSPSMLHSAMVGATSGDGWCSSLVMVMSTGDRWSCKGPPPMLRAATVGDVSFFYDMMFCAATGG